MILIPIVFILVIIPIAFILVIDLLSYDDYLWDRGRYLYSVVLGIYGEDDDSFEDYRVYANNAEEAKFKATKMYAIDNNIDIIYVDVVVVERIED